MILRILVFLLLLGAGFTVLHFAIGGKTMARLEKPTPAAESREPQQPTGPTVRVQGELEVAIKVHGAFSIAPVRDVQRGDRIVRERVYELTCDDSETLAEGVQRLVGVRGGFFDGDIRVADLVADEALLTLGEDHNHQISVREDKDIHLRRAVVTSRPEADLPAIRVELETARLRLLEHEIQVFTPSETDPVVVVVEGERPARLSGQGLQARLPRNNNSQLQRLDLAVLHQPVFTADQATVRSRGRMDLVQDLVTGAGSLSANDDVRMELTGSALTMPGVSAPAGAAAPVPVTVTGDRLRAWLRHQAAPGGRSVGSGRVSWSVVQIDGAPAVATGRGTDLRGPRLSLVPAFDGTPFLLAVSGGPSQLVQEDPTTGTTRFESQRRVQILRPGLPAAAASRAFGFPRWTLRQLEGAEAAWFAGRTSARTGDGTEVDTSDGLRILRPDDTGRRVVTRGSGTVRVARRVGSRTVEAQGNQGFVLDTGQEGEVLTLGPAAPASGAEHRYTLSHGAVRVAGTGTCVIRRDARGRVVADLRSPESTIEGDLGDGRGEFRSASFLVLEQDGDQITNLVAGGPAMAATLRQGDEVLDATAQQIEQEDSRTWLLSGAETPVVIRRRGPQPATDRDGPTEVIAPIVRVFQLGPRLAVVTAMRKGDRRAHVAAGPDARRRTVTLDADAVRMLPFAIPRNVLDLHLGGLPSSLFWVPGSSLTRPWLLAEGAVDAQLDQPDGDHVRGLGTFLALSSGGEAALLVGDPDAARPAHLLRREASGRSIAADAPRIRMLRGMGESMILLTTYPGRSTGVLPSIVLRDPTRKSGDALANLTGTCRGEIHVLPHLVSFDGPVQAHSLDDSGNEEPEGMHITAERLQMLRRPETGEVIAIEGRDGVRLDWSRINARAAELTLDLLRSRCTLSDPVGAEVKLPNGLKTRARHAVANYETLTLSTWYTSVTQVIPGDGIGR